MNSRPPLSPQRSISRLQAELALVQSLVRGTLARRAGFRAEARLGPSGSIGSPNEAESLLFELSLSGQVEPQFEQRLGEIEAELEDASVKRDEPLARLRKAFGLTRRELTVWMLCAAPQLDQRFRRLYAALIETHQPARVQDLDDRWHDHASEELLQAVLSVALNTYAQLKALLIESAPLRALGLIELVPDAGHRQRIRVPSWLVEYVLGVAQSSVAMPLGETKRAWPVAWERIVDSFWNDASSLSKGPFHLVGEVDDALQIFSRVCARAKLKQLTLDLRHVSDDRLHQHTLRALHDAGLRGLALVVVIPLSESVSTRSARSFLRSELQRSIAAAAKFLPLCATVEERDVPTLERSRPPIAVPRLASADRRSLWRAALATTSSLDSPDLPQGLSELPLGASAIARVAREFRASFPSRAELNVSTTREVGGENALLALARAALPPLETRFTAPVISSFAWQDLVVPESLRERLTQLCSLLTERERVLHDWGFASKRPASDSTVALFLGAPGTGKAMATSIIANQLGLGCHRVALAALVGPYAALTVENIRELFDAAERSHVVLLFEAADVLFETWSCSRADPRASATHAKSANYYWSSLEASYLWQRIESYPGLIVLTGNRPESLALTAMRDLRLVAHFPFPSAEARCQLWSSFLPADMPRADDVNLVLLSERVELAGGAIQNAALSAACRASAARRPLSMDDLLEASEQELCVTGQTRPRSVGRLGAGVVA